MTPSPATHVSPVGSGGHGCPQRAPPHLPAVQPHAPGGVYLRAGVQVWCWCACIGTCVLRRCARCGCTDQPHPPGGVYLRVGLQVRLRLSVSLVPLLPPSPYNDDLSPMQLDGRACAVRQRLALRPHPGRRRKAAGGAAGGKRVHLCRECMRMWLVAACCFRWHVVSDGIWLRSHHGRHGKATSGPAGTCICLWRSHMDRSCITVSMSFRAQRKSCGRAAGGRRTCVKAVLGIVMHAACGMRSACEPTCTPLQGPRSSRGAVRPSGFAREMGRTSTTRVPSCTPVIPAGLTLSPVLTHAHPQANNAYTLPAVGRPCYREPT